MKKWLIILSIIFITGFISSAVLAGHVYYKDLKTYEDYDKKDLKLEAIENVYIKSVVPVEIYPTNGEAYVEFTQSFVDLVGMAPKYKLDMQERGNSTYIDLTNTEENYLWLGVKENRAKLTIYLPEGDMNRLSIKSQGYNTNNQQREVINLEKINVNELSIEANHTNFNLNGSYDRVDIVGYNSSLNMVSTSLTELHTSGNIKEDLSGQFSKIIIKGNESEINIEAVDAKNVELGNSYGSIHLVGNYETIKIEGVQNDIDLRSDTECKLITEGDNNRIYANGAFNVLNLNERESEIEIQTTTIPEQIKMLNESEQTSLNLILPSNIPGFTVKYVKRDSDNRYDEYDYEIGTMNEEYLLDKNVSEKIKSEYMPLTTESEDGHYIYRYGTGDISILLNRDSELTLELIDGGYSSVVNQTR